jgi:hypothetical protein
MSTTLPRSMSHSIDESRGRKKSVCKVKAPFVLTTMNQRGQSPVIWVWSRRGSQWTVDQELRFDCDSKREEGGS